MLQNVKDDYNMMEGVSRSDDWPDDAQFRMDPDFPKDIKLEDFIVNENSLLVVSERVKSIVEAQAAVGNELLPVAVVNHKGRREKAPCYVLHQVTLQECIDLDKSVYTRNAIDPEHFSEMQKIVIDESKVDPKRGLLRMAHYPRVAVFRRDFADTLVQQGITGLMVVEFDQYDPFNHG
jgi:hypothetical protein